MYIHSKDIHLLYPFSLREQLLFFADTAQCSALRARKTRKPVNILSQANTQVIYSLTNLTYTTFERLTYTSFGLLKLLNIIEEVTGKMEQHRLRSQGTQEKNKTQVVSVQDCYYNAE